MIPPTIELNTKNSRQISSPKQNYKGKKLKEVSISSYKRNRGGKLRTRNLREEGLEREGIVPSISEGDGFWFEDWFTIINQTNRPKNH